jgi:hypothetical protein
LLKGKVELLDRKGEVRIMDPITIVAAVLALGAGFGASTYVSKQKVGSAEAEVKKEKEKLKN